ncbi:MAG TPA: cysteine hydrolase family protein [Tepidiformaceae bacterium]|nr:cysteine hydrolase family protein [Tepidiformaceae bacterium]
MEQLTARSAPYPWPFHGRFDPRRTAILVVRDGDIAPPDQPTIELLGRLVQRGRGLGVTIGSLPHGAPHGASSDPVSDITAARPHYGGFSGTDLDSELRKRRITDLIFAGFPFELGADCTMRQANDLGYECLALDDCCTGLAADTLAGAMSSIRMSGGIFGAVATTSAVLDLFERAHDAAPAPTGGSPK